MSDYVCLQSHNDALDDHRRIRMDEYKRDYRKLETKYCEKHPKEVYSLCCEKCFNVFCAGCVPQISMCSDGKAKSSHQASVRPSHDTGQGIFQILF